MTSSTASAVVEMCAESGQFMGSYIAHQDLACLSLRVQNFP